MSRTHSYDSVVTWTGNRGSGTSGYRDYDRTHDVHGDGRPTIAGSADAVFRGDATRWNPEQLLVVSLSQCHMLWYLHLAADVGVVVTGYVDRATGVMVEDGDGKGRFTEAVLRPQVTVAEPSMTPLAMRLHDRAHAMCFIARSVNFPVRHQPTVDVDVNVDVDRHRRDHDGDRSRAAVRTAYERYLRAFADGDLAGIDAVVDYPLAHVGHEEVRMCDSFPIDPATLRHTTGWHTTINARYDVVAVSPDKAHVVLHSADRVTEDGSPIETVEAFYAFKRTDDGWKVYAISDIVTPAIA